MATPSQLLARIIDLFGPAGAANPTALMGNLTVAPSGRVLVAGATDDASGGLIVGADISSQVGKFQSTRYATGGALVLRSAAGSVSAATALGLGAQAGTLTYRGYDGANYQDVASMDAWVDTAVTSASSPASLRFYTTPVASVAKLERLRITNAGRVLLNTTTDNTVDELQVAGSVNSTGGYTFSGVANRIMGDFSNTTQLSRLMVQSSTVNGNTAVGVLPNGTSVVSAINFFGAADPTNTSIAQFANYGTDVRLQSSVTGTGAFVPLTFWAYAAERMRFVSNGSLVVGATTVTGITLPGMVTASTTGNLVRFSAYGYGSSQGYALVCQANNDTGAVPIIFLNAAGTNIGQISTTSSATSYATTSDYRLKENVVPLVGALERVMAAKPVQYTYIADEAKQVMDGFLAHELAEISPAAVIGEKDATWTNVKYREGHDPKDVQPEDVLDIDHQIEPQMVDHSKVVPLLLAAIQELNLKVDAQAELIAQLQAK
jgi:hypothetical protein